MRPQGGSHPTFRFDSSNAPYLINVDDALAEDWELRPETPNKPERIVIENVEACEKFRPEGPRGDGAHVEFWCRTNNFKTKPFGPMIGKRGRLIFEVEE